jgi:hypothetical protein
MYRRRQRQIYPYIPHALPLTPAAVSGSLWGSPPRKTAMHLIYRHHALSGLTQHATAFSLVVFHLAAPNDFFCTKQNPTFDSRSQPHRNPAVAKKTRTGGMLGVRFACPEYVTCFEYEAALLHRRVRISSVAPSLSLPWFSFNILRPSFLRIRSPSVYFSINAGPPQLICDDPYYDTTSSAV